MIVINPLCLCMERVMVIGYMHTFKHQWQIYTVAIVPWHFEVKSATEFDL